MLVSCQFTTKFKNILSQAAYATHFCQEEISFQNIAVAARVVLKTHVNILHKLLGSHEEM